MAKIEEAIEVSTEDQLNYWIENSQMGEYALYYRGVKEKGGLMKRTALRHCIDGKVFIFQKPDLENRNWTKYYALRLSKAAGEILRAAPVRTS